MENKMNTSMDPDVDSLSLVDRDMAALMDQPMTSEMARQISSPIVYGPMDIVSHIKPTYGKPTKQMDNPYYSLTNSPVGSPSVSQLPNRDMHCQFGTKYLKTEICDDEVQFRKCLRLDDKDKSYKAPDLRIKQRRPTMFEPPMTQPKKKKMKRCIAEVTLQEGGGTVMRIVSPEDLVWSKSDEEEEEKEEKGVATPDSNGKEKSVEADSNDKEEEIVPQPNTKMNLVKDENVSVDDAYSESTSTNEAKRVILTRSAIKNSRLSKAIKNEIIKKASKPKEKVQKKINNKERKTVKKASKPQKKVQPRHRVNIKNIKTKKDPIPFGHHNWFVNHVGEQLSKLSDNQASEAKRDILDLLIKHGEKQNKFVYKF